MDKKGKWLVFPMILTLLTMYMGPLSVASADSDANVTLSGAVGTAGSSVKLELELSNVTKSDTIGVKFNYDAEVLELSESSNWICQDGDISSVDVDKNSAVWTSAKAQDLNGKIFEVVFDIKEGASFEVSDVEAMVTVKHGNATVLNKVASAQISLVSGVNITGCYKCFGSSEEEIIIELLKNGVVVDSENLTGNLGEYSFVGVEVSDAIYTVNVKKKLHCAREYRLDMAGTDIELDVEIWLYGDVNKSGKTDSKDATQISKYVNHQVSVFDGSDEDTENYRLKVGDVNKSGKMDSKDATQISKYVNHQVSVFDAME